MDDSKTLEDILVAEVLILSHAIDSKKRAKGSTRISGDYTSEAINQIKAKRNKILDALMN